MGDGWLVKDSCPFSNQCHSGESSSARKGKRELPCHERHGHSTEEYPAFFMESLMECFTEAIKRAQTWPLKSSF